METLRPALQRVYMTRASAYRDALKSFIQGYQEGVQQVREKKEESNAQQGDDRAKKQTSVLITEVMQMFTVMQVTVVFNLISYYSSKKRVRSYKVAFFCYEDSIYIKPSLTTTESFCI